MSKIKNSSINLHIGIESILPRTDDKRIAVTPTNANLPKAVHLTPSEQNVVSFTEEKSSKLDAELARYIQPNITKRDTLIPVNFAQNMQKAKDTLNLLAENDPSAPYQEAIAVLAEDTKLQETLNIYRTMLLQG